MKKIVLFFICSILFLSCKKGVVFPGDYAGNWEYRGFIGYGINTNLPQGNGKVIVLKKNGKFERWQHDTLMHKGFYILTMKDNCSRQGRSTFIVTNDKEFTNDFPITKSGDSLFISTPACYADGGSAIYVRVSGIELPQTDR